MLDERSTHSTTSLVHFPFKTWSRPLGSFSSPSLLGQLVKGDTELLNGFLKVIKQVRSRSRHWSSGPGSIIHSRQAGPSNIYIYIEVKELTLSYSRVISLILGSLKEKISAKLPTESRWGTPGTVHTLHTLWSRGLPLEWDHLESTPYSVPHCETSGRSTNLSGSQLFNLSNETKNAPQHKALWQWKGSCVWKNNL